MPNKKISQLVNKTTILSTDLFPIGDATSGQLYKKTIAELQAAIGGAVISVNGLVGTVVLDTDDIQELVSPTNKWFTDARARGAVSATSPLAYNSSTGVFSIPAATTSANGYLTSTDWNTFNGKENVLTFSSPLVRTSNTISMPAATTSVNGYLTSTDWNTFNNKQGALTLTTTGSSGSATLASNTLNIPTYTLAGLGGITASFLSGGTGITYNSGTGVIATTITQYTDALARASLSFTAGSGAYNSTTGVITIPTNTSQLTNGANFITLGSLSGGTGITYNSTTGAISYSGTVYTDSSIRSLFSGSTGISYNSTTGAISSTITQYTDALARGAISLTTTGSSGASTYNSTTGVLNVPTYTLSGLGGQPALSGTGFVKISGTTISYDNSTYLTTASAASTYQTIITNPVTGTGTTNYLPKWTSSSALGNSNLQTDSSGNLGLGITPSAWNSSAKVLEIAGLGNFVGSNSYDTWVANNAYLDNVSSGTFRYARTGVGTAFYSQSSAQHIWYTAPSGTAGNAITFTQAMTLSSSGNLSIGNTNNNYKLDVSGQSVIRASITNGISLQAIASDGNATIYLRPNNSGYNLISSNYLSTSPYLPLVLSARENSADLVLWTSGNTSIGQTTDSGYKLDVNGTGRFGSRTKVGGGYITDEATNGNNTGIVFGAGNIFSCDGSGNLTAKDFGSSTYKWGNVYATAATFSSSVSATSLRSSGVGTFGFNTANNGEFQIYATALDGIVMAGRGSSNDMVITNKSGSDVFRIPTGTTTGYFIGSVGIGTSSPGQKLEVVGNINATSTSSDSKILVTASGVANTVLGFNNSGATSYGMANNVGYINILQEYALVFGTASAERMRITSGGNLLLGTSTDNGERLYISGNVRATGTITANSDIRLKKNLERIENALEKVGQISGYTYDTIYDDKRHGGVIAQEIDEVFPEIVNKGNDGLLGVEYGNISALLIEALKELKEKNTALEARLQALEK